MRYYREVSYMEEFPPLRGDRVFYEGSVYRVIGITRNMLALKRVAFNIYIKARMETVIFIKPCPWYLPWQK